ncbi:MAG: hypothetical protein ACI4JB_06410 [Porcipelethomonas sp.]
MTDKELQKLKRPELLEIMLGLQKELDREREENKSLRSRLDEKMIAINKSGSIAEAALEVNGVLNAAQKAADVYLENIRKMHADEESNYKNSITKAKTEAEAIVSSARKEAETMIAKTDVDCRTKLKEADAECSRRISETNDLCTKKIKETQEKCTAISSLDNQIASFFGNSSGNSSGNSGAQAGDT